MADSVLPTHSCSDFKTQIVKSIKTWNVHIWSFTNAEKWQLLPKSVGVKLREWNHSCCPARIWKTALLVGARRSLGAFSKASQPQTLEKLLENIWCSYFSATIKKDRTNCLWQARAADQSCHKSSKSCHQSTNDKAQDPETWLNFSDFTRIWRWHNHTSTKQQFNKT